MSQPRVLSATVGMCQPNISRVKLARSTPDVAKSEFASKRFGDSTQAPRCRLPKYFDMALIDRSYIIDTPAYDDLNCKRKRQPQRDEERDGNDQQQVIEIQRSTHLPKKVHHCHAPLPGTGNSKANTTRALLLKFAVGPLILRPTPRDSALVSPDRAPISKRILMAA